MMMNLNHGFPENEISANKVHLSVNDEPEVVFFA